MSTTVVSAYQGTPGLGTAIFIQVRNPSSGAVLNARTNGGIREDVAASGFYTCSQVVTTDIDSYEVIWDENATYYTGEIVFPRDITNVTVDGGGGGGGGTPLPIVGDANADILGKTFLIKRGDTKPYIRRQLVDTTGLAIVLDGTETIKFTMRVSTDTAMAGPAKVHADAVIIDAPTGIVEYRWAAADTNTTTYTETSTLGRFTDVPYAAEFEVNYADLSVETFPQADYIAVSIPPDLDPGTTP